MSVLLFTLFILFVEGTQCLRNVRLILPEAVPEGGVATLLCLYELEREPLYSVKWYRGNYEIFRWEPREKPRARVFPLPGLRVDLASSNSHRLTLVDVPRYLGGNYSCEVSADEPAYSTAYVTAYLDVLPTTDYSTHKPDKSISENYAKLNRTRPHPAASSGGGDGSSMAGVRGLDPSPLLILITLGIITIITTTTTTFYCGQLHSTSK